MRAWMLSMAIGIAAVAWLPQLPPPNYLPLLLPSLLLLPLPLLRRWQALAALRCGLALLLGTGWGCLYGYHVRAGLLPLELEQQSLLLSGRVVGLVERQSGFQQRPVLRFQLAVDRCTIASQRCPAKLRRVQLNWYEAPLDPNTDNSSGAGPRAGEYWQLRVMLKRPRGFANPGGFDYAAWLIANCIGATGYVERSSDNRVLEAASRWSIDAWRDRAQHYLNQRLGNAQYRGLLLGLLIGDGSAIPQSQWELFRATGTVHLFVVSGLQIALTGGLMFGVGRLWWRSPLAVSRRRNYWIGIAPAWLAALAYALMAGFGLPLQRALIMFAVLLLSCVARREYAASSSWIFALWLTLLFDPLAVIDAGFWFSFIAVAAILLTVSGRRERMQWLSSWGRVQIAIFIASMPVLLTLSGQLTLLALPANLIAIPLSTFVTMPLALVALVCDALTSAAPVFDFGALWWHWADVSLQWLMQLLIGLQDYGAAAIWHPRGVSAASIIFTAIAVALLLLPRGVPGRWAAPIFLLPLLWPSLKTIAPGDYRLTVIDVGQGLSVLVETAEHRLLYDTGPIFGPERSVADLTVVPLLRRSGIDSLDTVIVSHKDNDHSGGLGSVAQAFATRRLLVGDSLGTEREEFCRGGMHWQWDGVDFEILHPVDSEFSGNNRSCVLQVRASGVVTLLPGDIERSGEYRLLDNPQLARADILLAPHHGSSSSSSATFIAQVRPRYVVFSSGYRNRFRHPNPAVEQRYREHNAELFNTALDGALIFDVAHGHVAQITRARSRRDHYWD